MSIVRESQEPTTAGTERIICGAIPATGLAIVTADLVVFGQIEYDGHLPPAARQGALIDASAESRTVVPGDAQPIDP